MILEGVRAKARCGRWPARKMRLVMLLLAAPSFHELTVDCDGAARLAALLPHGVCHASAPEFTRTRCQTRVVLCTHHAARALARHSSRMAHCRCMRVRAALARCDSSRCGVPAHFAAIAYSRCVVSSFLDTGGRAYIASLLLEKRTAAHDGAVLRRAPPTASTARFPRAASAALCCDDVCRRRPFRAWTCGKHVRLARQQRGAALLVCCSGARTLLKCACAASFSNALLLTSCPRNSSRMIAIAALLVCALRCTRMRREKLKRAGHCVMGRSAVAYSIDGRGYESLPTICKYAQRIDLF
eukprot:IDg17155t1